MGKAVCSAGEGRVLIHPQGDSLGVHMLACRLAGMQDSTEEEHVYMQICMRELQVWLHARSLEESPSGVCRTVACTRAALNCFT